MRKAIEEGAKKFERSNKGVPIGSSDKTCVWKSYVDEWVEKSVFPGDLCVFIDTEGKINTGTIIQIMGKSLRIILWSMSNNQYFLKDFTLIVIERWQNSGLWLALFAKKKLLC